MATAIARQIERRMKVLGLNQRSLAIRAKLNDTGIRDILEGKSKNPRADTLGKIARALGCTAGDLTGDHPQSPPARDESDNQISIPELDVHVSAGLGADDGHAIMAAYEQQAIVGMHTYPIESFREAFGTAPNRIRIIPVRGNSMEPELWAGQRVMVDIEDKTPSPPGIFVVWDGLGLVLKFIEVVANSDPLRVRITSAHHAFQPYERNLEEAYINGRVIGVWARK